MRMLRVLEQQGEEARIVELHDVTHRRQSEAERLRAVLELAYPDRERFQIEEEIAR